MEIEGLLRSQVEQLAMEVHRAGVPPTDFATRQVHDDELAGPLNVPAILHRPTGGFFAFARQMRGYAYSDHLDDIGHRVGFSPGTSKPFEIRGPLEWNEVRMAFRTWLTCVEREAAAGDLWSAPLGSVFEFPEDARDQSRPFEPQVQAGLQDQLDRIEEALVKAAGEQREAAEEIRRDLRDLRAELGKMRRGKWKKYAMGTFVSWSVRHYATPDAIQHAFGALRDFVVNSHPPVLPP